VRRRRFRCTSDFLDTGAPRLVDLGAIPAIFQRKLHDRVVDISIDHQKALVRLLRPFPPQIKGSSVPPELSFFPVRAFAFRV
jgi:hypothetical protein